MLLRRTALASAALLAAAMLTAGQPATAASPTVAARQHFFGAANVDSKTGAARGDKLILAWASVATLVASIRGHVVLLDTYIHKREATRAYVPATLDDLVALKPSYIFIGHGHFDHADTAGEIAVRTGATVIGTAEHCAQTQAQAEEFGGPGARAKCRAVIPAGAEPGYRKHLGQSLMRGVPVTAVKHVHSDQEPPDPTRDPSHNVFLPTPDPQSFLMHPPGPDAIKNSLENAADEEGGSVLYQFRVRDFAFTWHDSSGPLKEQAPHVFKRLRALPPTDIQAGAILGFNQLTNGLRDPAMYAAALCPKVFIPLHHDFITEYGSADDYEPPLRRELASYGAKPRLRWLTDPHDYVRPELMTYHLFSRQWKNAGAARPCR